MTTAQRLDAAGPGAREWMWQAFTRIKALHERMDAATNPVEQQRLSDESALVAEPWESSHFATEWRELWQRDSESGEHAAVVRAQAQRDRLAIELDATINDRDRLKAERAQADTELEQLRQAAEERRVYDRLRAEVAHAENTQHVARMVMQQ
ncbi:hypothetical protein [Nocardia arthritidis]|uniref:Flagellar FliJ protein n=1 Tax=Nocardia arthritidis TaxID=228602 RepID=A0A6G9YBI0_9NOCA|nr:hypothetical protein [Nocardia arthritidis]QIS10625.1 hypothetical protein F5544_13685 [Nocardia arthritidis]